MKTTVQQLRDKLANWPKYPGAEKLPASSTCNKGFPSCFNLSFGEPDMVDRFGQYLDYESDFIYSKIQPCIRHQDLELSIIPSPDQHRYLTVFDMADVGGLIILKDGAAKQQAITEFSVDSLMEFLLTELKLDKTKLRIAYFGGGTVREATDGKYPLDNSIPEDPYRSYYQTKWGLTTEQFLPNYNRDTFLALNVFGLPTPWGYRNEVFYEHQGKLVDIATIEYLCFRPVMDEMDGIVDLEPFESAFAISAVGVERVAMVVNDLSAVWEIDTIKPLLDQVIEDAHKPNYYIAVALTQALRVLHRVFTDSAWTDFNKRRKEYARNYLRVLTEKADLLGIGLTPDRLLGWITLNAQLQPFYPELAGKADQAAGEINRRLEVMRNDPSKRS